MSAKPGTPGAQATQPDEVQIKRGYGQGGGS